MASLTKPEEKHSWLLPTFSLYNLEFMKTWKKHSWFQMGSATKTSCKVIPFKITIILQKFVVLLTFHYHPFDSEWNNSSYSVLEKLTINFILWEITLDLIDKQGTFLWVKNIDIALTNFLKLRWVISVGPRVIFRICWQTQDCNPQGVAKW